jgi:hypothetical protein
MLGHRIPRIAWCLLIALLAVAGVAAAQTAPAAGGRWERDRLRQVIEERYRVVPLQDGVALVPRHERADLRNIEIEGSTVAIDGTVVTGAELRQRLRGDSEAVLALSYLEPAERKALFQPRPAEPLPETTRPGAEQPRPPVTPEPPQGAPPEAEPVRDSHADARIHIGGGVTVAAGETVDGPVVAIGGPVTVDGEVRQDVVAIGGDVRLGPKARVLGDVTSVGGTITRDPHAEILGRRNEIAFGFPHLRFRPGFWLPAGGLFGRPFGPGVDLMASAFRMLLFGLLAVLVFVIARVPVERVERVAGFEPWKAGLVGLLTELLFIPVFVLTVVVLAVSIIGIPLLLFVPPLAIVALMVALVIGFTAVAYRVGSWLAQRFGWQAQAPLGLLLTGLLGIWAVTLVGRLVSFAGWPAWSISAALLIAGFVVEYLAWTIGLGAAVMTRLGTRAGVAAVPPPVPPAAPPVA